jgi:hypothetical protein
MHAPHPALRPLLLLVLSCLTLGLTGCRSTKAAPAPSMGWRTLPTFSADAPRSGKIKVEWRNASTEVALDGLKQSFLAQARSRGFEETQDAAEADYIYCLSVRFFGENPFRDRGEAVLSQAGPNIVGGYSDWEVEGVGYDTTDRRIKVVTLTPPDENFFKGVLGTFSSSTPEFALLLDVAIAEADGDPAAGNRILLRREARLLGSVDKVGQDRSRALTALRDRVTASLGEILP